MSPLPDPATRRPARRLASLVAAAALFVAACNGGASSAPSVAPSATGALVPPATASAPPSIAASPSAAAAAFPVTVTGDDGVAVTLTEKPDKIVSLTPAETEVLYAIGAGESVAGKVEDIANFPPEAKAVPVVSSFGATGLDVDTEKIVGLGTDLVIAGGEGGTPQDAIDKLRSLKIPVLVLYAPDVNGVYQDIAATGDAVGESDKADALVLAMKSRFVQVAQAAAGATRPRVFYETGDQPSIYGIAQHSVYEQMITIAGGTPITTGSATNWEMPIEKLVQADPELIILGDSAYGVTADAVAKRPGWAAITAVKQNAIKGIDDILVTRPGPRLADGLLLLANAIHPELGLPRALAGRVRRLIVATRQDALAAPTAIELSMAGRRRPFVLAVAGLVALAVAFVAAVAIGTVPIAPVDTLAIIVHRLLPFDLVQTWTATEETIVWDLRLPRVLEAMIVGLGLAVAGTTFQGLLRNPLADPYVLGTASGAALGAAIAVVIPIRIELLAFGLLQILAFAGALLSVTAVYRLSRTAGGSPMTSLLLTGYALGSLLAAALAMAMYLSGAALRQIFAYLLGSFENASWGELAGAIPLIAIGSILILVRARTLNGLLLGEESAAHLGVDVRRERAILLGLASLVTAAAVAVSGLIGFVGLVVPHVVRMLVGPNARLVLPLSAIGGALLMVVADLAARMLGGIPVGVITAVIGAPFFLFLLRRSQRGYEL